MDARWIVVKDRQAGLLAEAEAERFARRVRAARVAARSAPRVTLARMARSDTQAGHGLVAVAAAVPTAARLSTSECSEA